MNLLKSGTLLCLALAGALAAAADPDWNAIVGPYPQLGTPTAQGELAVMVWLQHARTQRDVARAQGERHPDLGCFWDVLPVQPSLISRPMTSALLDQARSDLLPIVRALQDQYARPRPFVTFPALMPAIAPPSSPSYPSGHAAVGMVYAQILAQFRPASAEPIRERGRLLGDDRAMAGVHWPSDVDAGQKLGRAFATWWIGQPGHRAAIVACCAAEWH